MTTILLDTSVIIDFLRQKDKKETLLGNLTNQAEVLSLSIISHTELYAGSSVWKDSHSRDTLETVLNGLLIIPYDHEISEKAGYIRCHHKTHLIDAMIAATALSRHLPLATLNTKHFMNIRGLKLYV